MEGGEIEKEIINAGDMVYDPPNVIHAGRFLEDTVEVSFVPNLATKIIMKLIRSKLN